jgi:hypothetical protein
MIFHAARFRLARSPRSGIWRHPEYASGGGHRSQTRTRQDLRRPAKWRMSFVLVVMARPVKVPCYPPLLVPCAFHRGRCPFFAFRLAFSRPCASPSNTKLEMAGRLLERNDECHLRSTEEMVELFSDLPQATGNTGELSARLEYTLVDLGYEFPRYPVPEGETMDSFLRKRTEEGFQNRYGAKRNEELFERAQSGCNGNRRCCLSFEWCGEGKLRTPRCKNQESCFLQ